MHISLTAGGDQKKRRALDFYPTPPDVTHALMKFLSHWNYPKRIWEPACGTGEMSEVIKSYGHRVYSSDIRNTGYGDEVVDFLKAEIKHDYSAIITNPPFNTSEQFIRRAVETPETVAMLLKSQYWHASKRYDLFRFHRPTYILPLTWRPDFLNGERGGSPTMECIWTVWMRGSVGTQYIPLRRPK